MLQSIVEWAAELVTSSFGFKLDRICPKCRQAGIPRRDFECVRAVHVKPTPYALHYVLRLRAVPEMPGPRVCKSVGYRAGQA